MKTMLHYLIIMLAIMLFILQLVVVFTTTMGIEFPIQSLNVNFEIVILLVTFPCIILMAKSKLSGAIIYLVAALSYEGPDLYSHFLATGGINAQNALPAFVSLVSIIIPIVAFFTILAAKKQERKPVDKKTDFFYKNEAYDRKYDDRADKNNYRTL